MADEAQVVIPIADLRPVDRSRYVDGVGYCRRARYLNYHSGPNGYGMAMKATKLPLMTGIGSHNGVAPIMEWCRDNDHLVVQGLELMARPGALQEGEVYLPIPDQVVRDAIRTAQDDYGKVVEARGFAYLTENEEQQYLLREQQYLIAGMIWAWCLTVLVDILKRGRVLEVEHDDVYVVGCTCALGDGIGSWQDHASRACTGIGLQCRPDFLILTRDTQELEYHEIKTTGMDAPTFRDKWEVMLQMFSATLDAERRHGKHVQSIYVHGFIKGKREGDYNPESGRRDGFIRQNSVCCYGYRLPGNPPMEPEKWAGSYEYTGEDGKTHKLGGKYKKTGVWDLPDEWVPAGMSKSELWMKSISREARGKCITLLGPFTRQSGMVEHFFEELIGEENRWQGILWELYEVAQACLGDVHVIDDPDYWKDVWSHPAFQAALDARVPRSYECRRYGKRHRCQFEDLCFYREGWHAPMGNDLGTAVQFLERRPHHAFELDQAIARGLLPPAEGAAEDEEREL